MQPWRKMQACEKDDTERDPMGLVHPRDEKIVEEYFDEVKKNIWKVSRKGSVHSINKKLEEHCIR